MSLKHRSTVHADDTPEGAAVMTSVREEVVTPAQEPAPRRGVMETPEGFARRDASPPTTRATRGAPVGLIFGGFLALLLSAWAGIAPLVGPTFGVSADGTSSWTWNEVHALGAVVPGAVGVIACVIVLACARRPMGLQSAGTLGFAGFVLFLCGAWLTVVPVAWPMLVGPYFHAATNSLTFEYWMGLASGPGLLLATFGGIVMGRAGRESMARRMIVA
ncbi:MAG: hypothetical protein WCA31_12650 [Acidimicrobiales bacterium]